MRANIGIFIVTLRRFYRNDVQKLNKTNFIRSVCALVGVLFIIRLSFPSLTRTTVAGEQTDTLAVGLTADSVGGAGHSTSGVAAGATADVAAGAVGSGPDADAIALSAAATAASAIPAYSRPHLDFSGKHPIRGVHSYRDCFPDVQDVQIVAAKANGVTPVACRADAEGRKSELLYVGLNPYYEIDPRMNRSIPYLVPRASNLLEHISRRFIDSLAVKQIPLHKLIVTSVLRTEEDVARLQRYNHNATEQSCHCYATTFDISYNRFHTVSPPGGPERRAVRSDSLKYVLCEVLRDVRNEGRCYVKYEVKQGCFHITVR